MTHLKHATNGKKSRKEEVCSLTIRWRRDPGGKGRISEIRTSGFGGRSGRPDCRINRPIMHKKALTFHASPASDMTQRGDGRDNNKKERLR